jgi:hypothetical protein
LKSPRARPWPSSQAGQLNNHLLAARSHLHPAAAASSVLSATAPRPRAAHLPLAASARTRHQLPRRSPGQGPWLRSIPPSSVAPGCSRSRSRPLLHLPARSSTRPTISPEPWATRRRHNARPASPLAAPLCRCSSPPPGVRPYPQQHAQSPLALNRRTAPNLQRRPLIRPGRPSSWLSRPPPLAHCARQATNHASPFPQSGQPSASASRAAWGKFFFLAGASACATAHTTAPCSNSPV